MKYQSYSQNYENRAKSEELPQGMNSAFGSLCSRGHLGKFVLPWDTLYAAKCSVKGHFPVDQPLGLCLSAVCLGTHGHTAVEQPCQARHVVLFGYRPKSEKQRPLAPVHAEGRERVAKRLKAEGCHDPPGAPPPPPSSQAAKMMCLGLEATRIFFRRNR